MQLLEPHESRLADLTEVCRYGTCPEELRANNRRGPARSTIAVELTRTGLSREGPLTAASRIPRRPPWAGRHMGPSRLFGPPAKQEVAAENTEVSVALPDLESLTTTAAR